MLVRVLFLVLIATVVSRPPAATAQLAYGESFTIAELDSLAIDIVKTETVVENFASALKRLNRSQMPRRKSDVTMDYDFSSVTSDASCTLQEAYNPWSDKFVVFRCVGQLSMPPLFRVLALGYDGSLFLLYGFQKQDVNELIHEKIGGINSESDALQFAKFYVNYTLLPGYFKRVFIDDTNHHTYDSLYRGLQPPIIRKGRGTYRVTLFSVEPSTGRVWRHEVILRRDSLVKEVDTVIRKGKDTEIQ